ncbi:histone-lysine N-methyltransferase trithorax-like protein [Trema orientale]|uniref:Histone-lysine N-methyltransferase trithorax-like protein n=1 Tax=Trema orientale TaxID=63057 RepID=A0A2P5FBV8_TREOI|nr:histone-lysine N-methyltransferase trithorax-like protein [Trema orientale]
MKREGRQHGMVRTYRILPSPLNPRPETRFVNRFDSPATAGLFNRVSSKPTNHSKFTGKCGQARCSGCHLHPACKAKDKTKGTQKLKSNDVVSNHRLLTWRVVDGRTGSNFSGFSATRMLDQLSNCYADDNDNDNDEEEEVGDVDDRVYGYDDGPNGASNDDPTVLIQPIETRVEINHDDDDDEKEERMSFCDVGFVLDQVDDGWCLVGEM